MSTQKENRQHALVRRILLCLAVVVMLLAGATAWYFGSYYHATDAARASASDENGMSDGVSVSTLPSGALVFVPQHPTAGLILYPGAKVEATAYATLAEGLAQRGILCAVTDPPLNFAFFDIPAAGEVIAAYDEVSTWLVGGHSLGGVAACTYASQHEAELAGIVLLASYPASDLTAFEGRVLSLVGSNDEVLDREAYAEARQKLPATVQELTIVGGNHANYADYGPQAGDGKASISRKEQQAQTIAAIAGLIQEL